MCRSRVGTAERHPSVAHRPVNEAMSDPRHNLPVPPDDLIGRERDVADLRRIIAGTRMVTLVGTGGIGKTRLALDVADGSAASFADGARFVDLGQVFSPEQVASAAALATGVSERGHRSPEDAVAMALRSRSVLLVIDTCEHVAAAAAALCAHLIEHCPGVHILATSRQPLRVEREAVWRVPPLSVPPDPGGHRRSGAPPLTPERALASEAVRLFVSRALAARPGFELTPANTGAVAAVCRMLEGVPLAIELAAARIRVLSAQQVLARLDDRFRLLATDEPHVPARQRTMRAALEWSHGLLSPAEQLLLRRLAVFCTWSLDKAVHVCSFGDLDPGQARRAHTWLVDKSLVALDSVVGSERHYRLTDTVRAFAAAELAAAGEEQRVWRRMLATAAEWYEGLAERLSDRLPWEERLEHIRVLDHCLDNTLQMLERAVGACMVEEGLRICAALRSYWYVRDLHQPACRAIEHLLESGEGAAPLRARAAAVRAELMLGVHGPEPAETAAREALEAAEECGDGAAAGIARTTLAMTALRRGNAEEGLGHGREALRLAIASGERFTEICSLGALSQLARSRGDDDSSEVFLTRSIAIGQDIGDRWCVARCLNALGMLSTRRGDLDAAARQLHDALQVFVEMELVPDIARCTAGLGYLDLVRGDVSGARRQLSAGLRMSVASGRRLAVAHALEALGDLAVAEEQPERAASLAGSGALLRESLGVPAVHAEALLAEARSVLSDDAAEKAWHAWRGLPLEQVVENALYFPTPRKPLPSLLTRREKEISVLVSQGLSNRQIADRLTISQATAARHIANIFRKLLFTSRSQLAEWAREHRLDP